MANLEQPTGTDGAASALTNGAEIYTLHVDESDEDVSPEQLTLGGFAESTTLDRPIEDDQTAPADIKRNATIDTSRLGSKKVDGHHTIGTATRPGVRRVTPQEIRERKAVKDGAAGKADRHTTPVTPAPNSRGEAHTHSDGKKRYIIPALAAVSALAYGGMRTMVNTHNANPLLEGDKTEQRPTPSTINREAARDLTTSEFQARPGEEVISTFTFGPTGETVKVPNVKNILRTNDANRAVHILFGNLDAMGTLHDPDAQSSADSPEATKILNSLTNDQAVRAALTHGDSGFIGFLGYVERYSDKRGGGKELTFDPGNATFNLTDAAGGGKILSMDLTKPHNITVNLRSYPPGRQDIPGWGSDDAIHPKYYDAANKFFLDELRVQFGPDGKILNILYNAVDPGYTYSPN